MSDRIDPVELAQELAKIATSSTSDAATGRRLVQLVERLMQAAGLPPGKGEAETPGPRRT